MLKKYATDFVRQIEDQKKNYSASEYVDLLKELKDELVMMIETEEEELIDKE